MQASNEFALHLLPAELILWSHVKPSIQCVKVKFKNKNTVKHIYEF